MAVTGGHLPGLTGLRGIAVALVVAYHLGHLGGGFVGVDVFFVLSGFLITTLLLRDTPRTPSDMVRWWGRRVRRLTPAVAVTVLAVAIAFAASSGTALDGLATLTWWQNWHLVAEGNPYWDPSPSPLRHAWSLSIEEQFYLLWPPVLVALGLVAGRLRRGPSPRAVVGGFALAGTVASFAWAHVLAGPVEADLSRIYFGTDTRAGALLVGCALAAAVHRRPRRRPGPVTATAFVLSVAALAGASVLLSPDDHSTYRGGLLVAALASAVVVFVSTRPGPVSRALSWSPLQWLGERSYALYLWTWPTQVLVEQRSPGLHRGLVALVTVAAGLLLADLSLRFVERPLRFRSDWARRLAPRRAAWGLGSAAVAVSLLVAASSTRPTVQEVLAAEFEQLPDPTTTTTTAPPTTTTTEPTTTAPPPSAEVSPATVTAPAPTTTTTTAPPTTTTTCVPPALPPGPEWGDNTSTFDPSTVAAGEDPSGARCGEVTRLLVVGDSTGRGAANGLRRLGRPGLEVWDRTVFGCGVVAPSSECPDWRRTWREAIDQIDPDIVLLYMRVVEDVVPGDDPPFTSPEGSRARRAEFRAAVQLLSSRGARVAWALPPAPAGAFYCDGRAHDSPCDPAWVELWHRDVHAVAREVDLRLIDVRAWIDGRKATARTDRPDGLHLSGPALDAHAAWLVEQLS